MIPCHIHPSQTAPKEKKEVFPDTPICLSHQFIISSSNQSGRLKTITEMKKWFLDLFLKILLQIHRKNPIFFTHLANGPFDISSNNLHCKTRQKLNDLKILIRSIRTLPSMFFPKLDRSTKRGLKRLYITLRQEKQKVVSNEG